MVDSFPQGSDEYVSRVIVFHFVTVVLFELMDGEADAGPEGSGPRRSGGLPNH